MRRMDAATVLVVDDDLVLRTALIEVVHALGHRALAASDGAEALRLLKHQRPDLVLCDLAMPHVDGWDVLEAVQVEAPHTPVIVVSGSDAFDDAIRSMHDGAFDYVLKPITDLTVLELAVRRGLERSELLKENRHYAAHLEAANARLESTLAGIRADEAAARRVQFHLMPPIEERVGPLTCTRWVLPSQALSGDFVDWFRIDRSRLGFYMADVSGHGVSSAFVALMVQGFIDRLVDDHREGRSDTITRPAATLGALNRYLLARRLDKHATVFYGVLDHGESHMTWSNAGQLPHAILHDGSRARFMEMNGFAVGHFDFAEYSESRWSLPERWALVLVSDGLLEVLPHSRLADKEQAILRLVPSPAVTIGGMMERASLDASTELPDDVTFMVLRGGEHA